MSLTLNKEKSNRQIEGVNKWIRSGLRGTLEYCTGLGKTRCALIAIHLLKKNNPLLTVMVVVPSIDLKSQWEKKLKKNNLPGEVHVVNTAIKLNKKIDLLIIDEIHRCGSETFSTIFTSIKYDNLLGLTATLKRLDGKHSIIKKYAPVVDSIGLEEAIEKKWVSDYVEYLVLVEPKDIENYKAINRDFLNAFSYFNNNFKIAMDCANSHKARTEFTKSICTSYNKELFKQINKQTMINAASFSRNLKLRKEYIYNHPVKIALAKYIINNRKDKKIITFSTLTKTANSIGGLVLSSKVKGVKAKREILNTFINMDSGVLNTCKKLDEGADIPDLSTAIILGIDSSKTRKTQRTGRVIRYEEGKKAEIFTIVLKGTVEETWFMNSIVSADYITIDALQLKNVLEYKPFTKKKNSEKAKFMIRF